MVTPIACVGSRDGYFERPSSQVMMFSILLRNVNNRIKNGCTFLTFITFLLMLAHRYVCRENSAVEIDRNRIYLQHERRPIPYGIFHDYFDHF